MTLEALYHTLEQKLPKDSLLLDSSTGYIDVKLINALRVQTGGEAMDEQIQLPTVVNMIYAWKAALSTLQSYRLEQLFPQLLPDSNLVGKNHRAAPDAMMLKALIKLYVSKMRSV